MQLSNTIIRHFADPAMCSHDVFLGFVLGLRFHPLGVDEKLQKQIDLLEVSRKQMELRRKDGRFSIPKDKK